jgi:hypothetical protein
MLLPALGAAREKARGSVCMGNLKQIGIAFALYQADWNSHMTPSVAAAAKLAAASPYSRWRHSGNWRLSKMWRPILETGVTKTW